MHIKTFVKSLSAACICVGMLCHSGCLNSKDSNSSIEEDCDLCHTSPVADDPNHKVSSGTDYDLSCNYCHAGYGITPPSYNDRDHLNDRIEVVFDTLALSAQFGSGSGITYAARSCSNIPCHGYGREDVDNITWRIDAGLDESLDCNGCHEGPTHRGGRDCDKCHLDVTSNDTTIFNYSLHIDGKVELDDIFNAP